MPPFSAFNVFRRTDRNVQVLNPSATASDNATGQERIETIQIFQSGDTLEAQAHQRAQDDHARTRRKRQEVEDRLDSIRSTITRRHLGDFDRWRQELARELMTSDYLNNQDLILDRIESLWVRKYQSVGGDYVSYLRFELTRMEDSIFSPL